MSKNNDKNSEQQYSNLTEAQRKEAWAQKNGGLVIGLGAFVLLVVAAVVMKACG